MRTFKFSVLAIAFSLFFSALPAQAAKVYGVLRVVKGKVMIQSPKKKKPKRARIGAKVFPKDIIITTKDSRAKVVMVDKNEINVSPDSKVVIQNYEYTKSGKKNVLLNVIYGKVRNKVKQKYNGKTSKFQVKTPSAVAGVRGTDFLTSFNPTQNATKVVTFEGEVSFGTPGVGGTINNPVSVRVGQFTEAVNGAAPAIPKSVPKGELRQIDKSSNADEAGDTAKRSEQPKAKENKKKKQTETKGPKKKEPNKSADRPQKREPKQANNKGPSKREPASANGAERGDKTANSPAPKRRTGNAPGGSVGGPSPDGASVPGGVAGSGENNEQPDFGSDTKGPEDRQANLGGPREPASVPPPGGLVGGPSGPTNGGPAMGPGPAIGGFDEIAGGGFEPPAGAPEFDMPPLPPGGMYPGADQGTQPCDFCKEHVHDGAARLNIIINKQ